MAGLKLVCIAVVCMVLASAVVDATITCGQVTSDLAPCIQYARGSGTSSVPPPCCAGVRRLNAAATTTPDRKQACTCLKNVASSISGIKYNVVESIPPKCGVSIPYKLNPNTDCNTVK